jgi:hypothetical protein
MSEHKHPKHKSEKIMPAFIFTRRHDIEVEAGFILAGTLIVDLPPREPTEDESQMVAAIVQQLLDAAQSGQLPDDAMIYGWHGGTRPPNHDAIVDDDKLMAAWAKDRCRITVRVAPRSDGQTVRVDRDIMRKMNLEN